VSDNLDEFETLVQQQPSDDEEESILTRLRRQRKSIAENQFIDLDLPMYNGEIFVRYRLLDGSEIDGIGQKVRSQTANRSERMLAQVLDTLILACQEIWVRDNGKEMPLRQHPEFTGDGDVPVRFDKSFAEFLDFEADRSRDVVLGIFGGNDIAASAHCARLTQWMMQSGADLNTLLGEL
jgi:hypothetical protein